MVVASHEVPVTQQAICQDHKLLDQADIVCPVARLNLFKVVVVARMVAVASAHQLLRLQLPELTILVVVARQWSRVTAAPALHLVAQSHHLAPMMSLRPDIQVVMQVVIPVVVQDRACPNLQLLVAE